MKRRGGRGVVGRRSLANRRTKLANSDWARQSQPITASNSPFAGDVLLRLPVIIGHKLQVPGKLLGIIVPATRPDAVSAGVTDIAVVVIFATVSLIG